MFRSRNFTSYATWAVLAAIVFVVGAGILCQAVGIDFTSSAAEGSSDGVVSGFKFTCPLH
ncbi:MAG TPA: hypothetical protein VFB90_09355 [Dehalococcoidia bacterium]|nr:hypothetical protein [Dehalococcoidia bacterium]